LDVGAARYVDDDDGVDFAAESVEEEVAVDSDDPDFAEDSAAEGLLSPLLSAAGAALVSEELLSEELAADLGA
jgi:hypothetical protein